MNDDAPEISRLIFPEKIYIYKKRNRMKMSSATNFAWCFKAENGVDNIILLNLN